ncbi:polyphosphoinositide binding protein Ssh2p [Thecamonas trahens ATCC 50062]|uniref:Polyphosphoinositide binding protein Ssh2p n=1 Tax=Thecamonas trahens ATCC 50062 TaxID=461836 RepID=A0A0L0DML5_THETB|nr:polyphosphoinositide binding protein Ssh2p [Thecamonas trahens ATCC 50062]KNC53552.1 polyphosphoinositide binding protein Ssh2p [Thecamonas trahens ATCC 50062]|eukprot:XP_013761871.1 polyphosphoinositide binding protein Ssh2p [Thecamonas trahens ATCC 50062]
MRMAEADPAYVEALASGTLEATHAAVVAAVAAELGKLNAERADAGVDAFVHTLYDTFRFGKAVAFEREATIKHVRDMIAWRLEHKPFLLSLDDPRIRAELATDKVHPLGRDKAGRVVSWFVNKRHKSSISPLDQYMATNMFMMEYAERHELYPGAPVQQVTMIADYADFGWSNLDRAGAKGFLSLQAIYPERLGAAYIINAGRVFKVLWALAKPFLDASTRAKVHFLTDNYQAELQEHILASQLPHELGGTADLHRDFVPFSAGIEASFTAIEAWRANEPYNEAGDTRASDDAALARLVSESEPEMKYEPEVKSASRPHRRRCSDRPVSATSASRTRSADLAAPVTASLPGSPRASRKKSGGGSASDQRTSDQPASAGDQPA